MECYKLIRMNFSKRILFKKIDACYVIHLVNNNRLKNIKDQLDKINITKNDYILFNKGYRNCKKETYINKPGLDLIDAYYYIFNHSIKNNYNNIIILEDDFILSDEIEKHSLYIDEFIKNKNDFIYYLGCFPLLSIPYNLLNFQLLFSLGTHAIIYNKLIINKILKYNKKNINDFDYFLNFKFIFNKYIYYKPLIYQLIEETDNQKEWININKSIIWKIMTKIMILIIKLLKLDIYYEPGTSIFYLFSKIIIFILIYLYRNYF